MADKHPLKKKLPGSVYRKRKAEKEKQLEIVKRTMNIERYLTKDQEILQNQCIASTSTTQPLIESQSDSSTSENNQLFADPNCSTSELELTESNQTDENSNAAKLVDVSDVGTWPTTRNRSLIDHIITTGPTQTYLNSFPRDENGRHFSSAHYSRKISNGEIIPRRWLVYSVSINCVFCFCCRLFNSKSTSNLVSNGFRKWKHLSDILKVHENSLLHKKYFTQWTEAEIRLKTCSAIDQQEQRIISRESLRWNNVLCRLMHITLYLAENNMAFRGRSDKLYTPNNGKFLGLVQLLAKFDSVMEEHVKLAMKGDISDHYCGKNIQQELIELLAEKVKSEILARIQKSKYYAIIADCTPDISHTEQLSLVLRFVDTTDNLISVKENFITFLPVNDTTGAGLTQSILKALCDHGLNLNDCRGQGYDNGANMKGKNAGVQKRISDLNPLAFFVPCGCHSYNLVLCDAAKSSIKSVSFFGLLEKLFVLFSSSVNRWKILTDHLKTYTLKKLSDTRWEARIDSVKAIRYQYCDVYDALVTLANETEHNDAATFHEATTIGKQLKDFGFIVSLITWYDILFQVNVVSKASQLSDIDLIKFTNLLKNCCSFLENYRKTGFANAIIKATEIAVKLNIDPIFKQHEKITRVRQQPGKEPRENAKKCFEIEFFNSLLDTALNSLQERFQQLNDFTSKWNFLYNLKNIPKKEELSKCCIDLEANLTVDSKSEIDGNLLCDELLSLKEYLKDKNIGTPISALNFIKQHKIQEVYPNVWITLRILLTIPVTVASGERSFSKLKLIKTYLRSTMSQTRLTSLAILSIENEITQNIDFQLLIKEFADKKARKVNFY